MLMTSRGRVKSASVFARNDGDGIQSVVFAASVEADEPGILLLPFPISPGGVLESRVLHRNSEIDIFTKLRTLAPSANGVAGLAAHAETCGEREIPASFEIKNGIEFSDSVHDLHWLSLAAFGSVVGYGYPVGVSRLAPFLLRYKPEDVSGGSVDVDLWTWIPFGGLSHHARCVEIYIQSKSGIHRNSTTKFRTQNIPPGLIVGSTEIVDSKLPVHCSIKGHGDFASHSTGIVTGIPTRNATSPTGQ